MAPAQIGEPVSRPQRSLAKKFAENLDSDDEEEVEEVKVSAANRVAGVLHMIRVFGSLNVTDVRKRKGAFCLGLLSVFIVVFVAAVMVTVLEKLPILFMRLGELETGEYDLDLRPGALAFQARSLNYTIVKDMFRPPDAHSFHAPRIMLAKGSTSVWNLADCSDLTPTDISKVWGPPSWATSQKTNDNCNSMVGCVYNHCLRNGSGTQFAELTFLDFEREARMQYGRAWDAAVPRYPGQGECVIDSALARQLRLGVGGYILVSTDVQRVMMEAFTLAQLNNIRSSGLQSQTKFTTFGQSLFVVRVVAVVDGPKGKFGIDTKEVIVLPFGLSTITVAEGLSPRVPPFKREAFAAVDPSWQAQRVRFNYPPDKRTSWYTRRDYAAIASHAVSFNGIISGRLGFNQLATEMPVVKYLYDNRFASLFLGLILSIVITGLSALSVVLIHALLTVGVETKTFELGVMRMVGMTRWNLVGYVLTHAMFFAIPGWAAGLGAAAGAFVFVQRALQSALEVNISSDLEPNGIGLATALGLGLPLLSAIAPIVGMLSQQLPAALDTSRGKIETVKFTIERSSDEEMNWTAVGLGICLAVFGFLIYYLFPSALVNQDFALLFYIFFAILLGMLFGLILLAVNFERVVESIVTYAFFFWENAAVFAFIGHNLTAHRVRNRKTTLMYSMAVGFIILVTVAFNIQIESTKFANRRLLGGDLKISGFFQYWELVAMYRFLHSEANKDLVRGVTWVSAVMTVQRWVQNTTLETIGRFTVDNTKAVAIAPNFFTVADPSFLRVAQSNTKSGFSLSEQLYTEEGSGKVILTSSLRDSMAIDSLNQPVMFETINKNNTHEQEATKKVFTPAAFLDASPVLLFSKFPQNKRQNCAMGLPAFMMRARALPTVEMVRFSDVIIVLKQSSRGAANLLEGRLIAEFRAAGIFVFVKNYFDTEKSLTTTSTVINFVFAATQVVSMFISFFALMSSMSTNIYEQTKEIGIMRCLGFRKFPCWRLYVWEAFVLVVSSSLLGLLAGTLIAYTILLQRALFTELPLPFTFPWIQIPVIVGAALVCAFFASFGPIRHLLSAPSITQILRRTV